LTPTATRNAGKGFSTQVLTSIHLLPTLIVAGGVQGMFLKWKVFTPQQVTIAISKLNPGLYA
jgi:hypothetical protein